MTTSTQVIYHDKGIHYSNHNIVYVTGEQAGWGVVPATSSAQSKDVATQRGVDVRRCDEPSRWRLHWSTESSSSSALWAQGGHFHHTRTWTAAVGPRVYVTSYIHVYSLHCMLFSYINLFFYTTQRKITRSSATAEIARDAWNGHSRSLKVIRYCANWRDIHVYDFLLALNSNLTSIFNRSCDITPSLHINTSNLFQVELEKDGWE